MEIILLSVVIVLLLLVSNQIRKLHKAITGKDPVGPQFEIKKCDEWDKQ